MIYYIIDGFMAGWTLGFIVGLITMAHSVKRAEKRVSNGNG